MCANLLLLKAVVEALERRWRTREMKFGESDCVAELAGGHLVTNLNYHLLMVTCGSEVRFL